MLNMKQAFLTEKTERKGSIDRGQIRKHHPFSTINTTTDQKHTPFMCLVLFHKKKWSPFFIHVSRVNAASLLLPLKYYLTHCAFEYPFKVRVNASAIRYNSLRLACVASVSNRVIGQKLERKQKKGWRGRGRGEEETLARKPHDSGKRPWYFTVRFICKLTARQNRNITNRLRLYYQICKITLISNRTRCRRWQEL